MNFRTGEDSNKVRYRSDRYVIIGNVWYFTTREGHNVGPFPNKNEAHKGLDMFLKYMQQDPDRGCEYAERVATRGLWESTLCH